MQRASGSGERTPLVQPTYVFESSLSRSYQKRLRHFQCAICVGFLALLAVALLVTTSYSLSNPDDDADSTTTAPVAPLQPTENLTAPQLMPLLKISWPLQGRPPPQWPGAPPTVDALSIAVKHGQDALKQRQALESKRTPLDKDSPALRAQRAAATSEAVKPMADTAYAIEEATKVLFNGTSKQPGEAFQGPPTNGSFPEPRYCQQAVPPCPQFKYRTLDGSCNSLEHPYRWGVSRTPFRRALPPDYGDGISSPRTATDGSSLPSARDVSVTVHRPSYAHDTSFTVMLAVWGQFVDHDITATALSKGENSSALSCCDSSLTPHPECFPVELDAEDPFYQEYNLTCMEFVRSAPCPTCFFGPREQMNQATAFIDGSTVYGYTHERASSLRLQAGGRLRMLRDGARELLPPATDPGDPCNTAEMNAMGRYCFETGKAAFIDGSTVYGHTHERASSLRLQAGGRLRMLRDGARELLPPATDPGDPCNTAEMNAMGRYCFETGKAAFIDGSTVYGHTHERASSLRLQAGGRLRMLRDGARELLPPATDPGDPCNTAEMNAMGRYCFETGKAAFIDGSTVYGHTHERASSLRLQAGGRLRMLRDGARELLPPATDPGDPCNTAEMNAMGRYCFETGKAAFIDGSTVYGHTHERASSLRLQAGGRLRMLRDGARELLPPATDPGDPCNTAEMNAMGRYCFETGKAAFIDGSTVYGHTHERASSLRLQAGGRLRMLRDGARELLPPATDPGDPCNTAEMNAMGRYCFETGKAAFIDGSTVYGHTHERASSLRLQAGGRLRMLRDGARELLPPATDPGDPCNTAEMNAMGRYCFETGDDRANENLHLTTMHLIWARQHNRVAAQLLELNPTWNDETLYQEARRIVGAQMQHITYSEFLPPVLGSDVMFALNLTLLPAGRADVYDPAVDPTVANHFSAAVFRFAHTLLPGLMHNVDASTGTINYVQLHEMLFNPYTLYSTRGAKTAVSSAMNTPVHNVDPHVTTELSNHLFERPQAVNSSSARHGPCGLDLVSLNIQRGRDHGLPAYPAWREHCGLSRPKTFEDLGEIFDDQSLSRICKIYKSVDDIDLYTGALAEEPRGRLLGPTLSCLLSDQFLRLKVGDRFWYETSDETVGFSIAQLDEIRKTTLAGVICANEELLDQAQPRVMEAVGPTNPLVDCKELPQPDFKPWQDNKIKKKKPTRR